MRLLFAFLMILSTSWSIARAQVVTVPEVRISGLGNHKGRFLTVIYGIGQRATLATSDDQMSLREIKYKRTFEILEDSISLPKVDLTRSGVFLAYNVTVFVVHRDPQFAFRNANGSWPEGERPSAMTQYLVMDSLLKQEIDLLMEDNKGPLELQFGSGLFRHQRGPLQ